MNAVARVSVLYLVFGLTLGCTEADEVNGPTTDLGGPSDTMADASSPADTMETDTISSVDSVTNTDTFFSSDTSTPADTGPSGCVSDLQCDDGDACTIDKCDVKTGFCSHENDATNPACQAATNDACTASDTPGTTDPEIQECVCTADPFCCETAWDELCVNQAEDCGALCGCNDPAADLSCGTDADCAKCNDDNDLCGEKWTCSGGTCANDGPVVCDTTNDEGCMVTSCNPFTGACEKSPDNAMCSDDDFCTTDSCNESTGECDFAQMEGCGLNTPCQPAETPGSNDSDVTACVCAIDDFCCSQWFGWTPDCAEIAATECGVNCDCNTLPPEELACTVDADCDWCGNGNPCDGLWTCDGGTCKGTGPTVCDESQDTECVKNVCNPETVHCEMTPQPSLCDDNELCTLDACNEDTGACVNEMKCGTNSVCEAVTWPGADDAAIQECVCNGAGADPYCCDTAWDSICVDKAESACGASCDCNSPDTDLACQTDDDCNFCNDDVCEGMWTCMSGTCQESGPLQCDSAGNQGCLKNTCQSFTGTCEVVPDPLGCDDGNACTADQCDSETGGCTNTPIPGCMGEPTFECKGPGEVSANGCEYVQTYEGCCDPWGRTLWCDTDPDTGEEITVCIDCAGQNPFCGWSGVYYTCGTEGETSGDEAFPMQCPGLDYAP